MKNFNRQTGILAEDLATRELTKKGYQILERNFRNKFGEIDIIAKDPSAGSLRQGSGQAGQADTLVFVEVKAKRGVSFGRPEEMINTHKLKRIQNMATIYMNGKNALCRIDVIAIVFSLDNKVISLTHYENVQL